MDLLPEYPFRVLVDLPVLDQQAEAVSPEIPMIAAAADLLMLKNLQRMQLILN